MCSFGGYQGIFNVTQAAYAPAPKWNKACALNEKTVDGTK